MTKNKPTTVSPIVRMFMVEVKLLKYDKELYFKRANVRKAFKRYCEHIGIHFNQLTPKQFYGEILVYLNERSPDTVTLDRVKCYDVFLGVTCEEFSGENDAVDCEFIDDYINELKSFNRG